MDERAPALAGIEAALAPFFPDIKISSMTIDERMPASLDPAPYRMVFGKIQRILKLEAYIEKYCLRWTTHTLSNTANTPLFVPVRPQLVLPAAPKDPRAQRVHELYHGGLQIDDLLRWFPSLSREDIAEYIKG